MTIILIFKFIFEKCVLNVFKNFVPNKYVVFDDKAPVWMNKSIKQLIKEIVFVVWLTDERRLALFSAGTIFRDPHHRQSPTRREQELSLRRA